MMSTTGNYIDIVYRFRRKVDLGLSEILKAKIDLHIYNEKKLVKKQKIDIASYEMILSNGKPNKLNIKFQNIKIPFKEIKVKKVDVGFNGLVIGTMECDLIVYRGDFNMTWNEYSMKIERD